MESQGIFSGTVSVLGKALDLRSMKHSLIVSNVANMDTPNYQAFDLIIEEEMEKVMGGEKQIELKKTRPGHLPAMSNGLGNVRPRVVSTSKNAKNGNTNSVHIDKEMASLAENNLMYNALAQIVARKFQGLKDVIRGGK